MPIKLAKNRMFAVLLGATVVYWAGQWLVPRYLVFEGINAILLAVSMGISVAFAPGAWRSLRLPWDRITGSHFVTVGIWLFWTVEACQRVFALVYRWLDRPPAMLDHAISGYLLWMSVFAGVFHILVRDAAEEVFPKSNWRIIGLIVMASMMALFMGVKLLGGAE